MAVPARAARKPGGAQIRQGGHALAKKVLVPSLLGRPIRSDVNVRFFTCRARKQPLWGGRK